MLAHAAGMVPFVGLGVSFFLFQTKKDASPFVMEHLKEALNFDLTLTPFDFVALLVLIIVGGVGILLWAPVLVAHLGLGIMGAMAAAEGKPYRYVINVRLEGGLQGFAHRPLRAGSHPAPVAKVAVGFLDGLLGRDVAGRRLAIARHHHRRQALPEWPGIRIHRLQETHETLLHVIWDMIHVLRGEEDVL
jgi:hypothetical protein